MARCRLISLIYLSFRQNKCRAIFLLLLHPSSIFFIIMKAFLFFLHCKAGKCKNVLKRFLLYVNKLIFSRFFCFPAKSGKFSSPWQQTKNACFEVTTKKVQNVSFLSSFYLSLSISAPSNHQFVGNQ